MKSLHGRMTIFVGVFAISLTAAGAQTTGYITGANSLTSFDSSTGAIISSFSSGGDNTVFAVAQDDTTLYVPTGFSTSLAGALNIVSGMSGQLLSSVALPWTATKVVLSNDGSTAYVLCTPSLESSIYIVDLATLAITGSLVLPQQAPAGDIALSPDGSTLYVSIAQSVYGGAQGCHTRGICVLDAETLTLTGHVDTLCCYLELSNDGKSLYVTTQNLGGPSRARVVNTATLTISGIYENNGIYETVVNPLGHWAVLLGLEGFNSTAMAYTLSTNTNKVVAEFITTFPGNTAPVGNSAAAFAPDGKSVWVLASCSGLIQTPGCSTVDNATVELVGFSFPSGQVISQTPVNSDSHEIAFPQ